MIRPVLFLAVSLAGVCLGGLIATNNAVGTQSRGFGAISIDMDPSGNTATSLGPRQECRDALPGATVILDVTIEDISPSTPLFGYQYDLNFQGPTIVVTKEEMIKIKANPGSQPFPASDPLPDSSGSWTASVIDLGQPASVYETGSGTLDRLTIEVGTDAAPGIYAFSISDMALIDPQAQPHSPPVTRNARLAIGVSCAGSTPLPEVTASPSSTGTGATEPPPTGGPTEVPPNGTTEPGDGTSSVDGTSTVSPGTVSASASGSPSPGPYGQPSPTALSGDEDNEGSSGWIILLIALVVIAGVIGGGLMYRRRVAGRPPPT